MVKELTLNTYNMPKKKKNIGFKAKKYKSPTKKRSCYKMKASAHDNSPMKKNFPDLTGDGKVTRADILKGRGVKLDSPAKNYKKGYYGV